MLTTTTLIFIVAASITAATIGVRIMKGDLADVPTNLMAFTIVICATSMLVIIFCVWASFSIPWNILLFGAVFGAILSVPMMKAAGANKSPSSIAILLSIAAVGGIISIFFTV